VAVRPWCRNLNLVIASPVIVIHVIMDGPKAFLPSQFGLALGKNGSLEPTVAVRTKLGQVADRKGKAYRYLANIDRKERSLSYQCSSEAVMPRMLPSFAVARCHHRQ